MTLPASGNLSMSAILAEFGAPPGTPLTAFLRGGAWVPNTPINVGVPTSLPISIRNLLGASATPAPPPINFTSASLFGSKFVPPTATAEASYQVDNSGAVRVSENFVTTTFETWRTGGVSSDYEIMATLTSGGAPDSGSVGVWQNASTSPSWGIQLTSAGNGYKQTQLSMQCRHIPTGNVVDTWSVNLSVETTT